MPQRFIQHYFSYISISYTENAKGASQHKQPFQKKGPSFFKAFSFYPELFNLFERFVLRFRTDRNNKQEAKDVNHRKNPECIGEPE